MFRQHAGRVAAWALPSKFMRGCSSRSSLDVAIGSLAERARYRFEFAVPTRARPGPDRESTLSSPDPDIGDPDPCTCLSRVNVQKFQRILRTNGCPIASLTLQQLLACICQRYRAPIRVQRHRQLKRPSSLLPYLYNDQHPRLH